MNHGNNDLSRAVRRALRCNPLGIQPRTAACASVLLAMATTAVMAADPPQGPTSAASSNADTELESITVTGIKAIAFEGKPDTVARLRAIPLPALSRGPLMVQWTLFYIARYNATTYNQ